MKRMTTILASLTLLALAAAPVSAAEPKGAGTKQDAASRKTESAKPAGVQGHPGQGTVNSVDAKAGKVNLTHGPIPSLNWPGMKMDFQVADKQALTKLKPGQKVEFKIVEKTKGQFVISEIAASK